MKDGAKDDFLGLQELAVYPMLLSRGLLPLDVMTAINFVSPTFIKIAES